MREEYIAMSAEQLAADEAFIAWQQEGIDALAWEKWLAQYPDRMPAVRNAAILVDALGKSRDSIGAQHREELWQRIDSATSAKAQQVKVRRLTIRRVSAAAAIICLISFGTWLFYAPTQVSVAAGSTKTIVLPEASEVTLNAESSVKFNSKSFTEERNISLKGEAFFSVQKGSSFTVETHAGSVRVLGTTFNVFQRDEMLKVSCYTGSVEVRAHDDVIVLKPGEEAVEMEGHLQKVALDQNPSQPGWMNGEFSFNNTPLHVVLDELARQYAVEIDASNDMLNRRYTGFFTKNSLDSALQSVLWPLHLKYVVSGGHVRITQ